MAADRDPAVGAGRSRRRIPWRWIAVAGLAAFVAWHAVFDFHVSAGLRAYVDGHARHAAGEGPAVTIAGVMDAAVHRGLLRGLAGAGAVLGLSAVAYAVSRRRERLGSRP